MHTNINTLKYFIKFFIGSQYEHDITEHFLNQNYKEILFSVSFMLNHCQLFGALASIFLFYDIYWQRLLQS